MCGVAGVWGQPDLHAVESMMTAMRPRGPDDQGLFADPDIVLGHRRLSILDLSAAGRQPMERHGLRLTYNGEIYNFRELRRDLEGRGHVFRTATDSEVILALYEAEGTDCVHRLRGMFAFAIWDPRGPEPILFLARDHFGIKPLVYAEHPGRFVFASDLPGIVASGLVSDRLDQVALTQFLMFGHVVQPRTILEDVRMLPAGHAMLVRRGRPTRLWKFWDLDHRKCAELSAGLDFEGQSARLRELLNRAAAAQMVSDVSLGAFLSGGIDSCALVALMTKVSGRPVHTFSVGFRGEGAGLDESEPARRSADYLGAIHSNVIVTGRDVAESLPRIVGDLGQPTIDGVNMAFVSRAARQGVTVALAGMGGDELFAGYPWAAELASAWGEGRKPVRRRLVAAVGRSGWWRALPTGASRERWELRTLCRDLPSHYTVIRLIRSPQVSARLAGTPETWSEAAAAYLGMDDPSVPDVIARVGRMDLRLYMASQMLRDTDAASMAHSLEVRVPFLDVDVAEFAYGLPAVSKLSPPCGAPPGPGKRVLLRAAQDLLPDWVGRSPKRGFTLPFATWLRGAVRDLAADVLDDSSFAGAGWIDPRGLSEAREDLLKGRVERWPRVWSLVVLGLWLKNRLATAPKAGPARQSGVSVAAHG
jgi:asparagine synthase (glutamine-hydrolysing)